MSAPLANNTSALGPAKDSSLPMWKIVLSQFLRHHLAVGSLVFLVFLSTIAVSAPLIKWAMQMDPFTQNITQRYLPPLTKSEAGQDQKESDIEKWIHLNPQTAETLSQKLIQLNYLTAPESEPLTEALFQIALDQDLTEKVNSLAADSQDLLEFQGMAKQWSHIHIFGTDELGRDVFMRLLYGTRVSMGVGVLVAVSSALIGLLIGSLAGFYGGWIDTVLMRLTDALLSLPTIPVLIVMAAIDLSKIPALKAFVSPDTESIFKMVFILVLFSWMTVARLVRGSVLSLREREFILAAKTLGATDLTIIMKHMFPNVITPIIVSITLGVGESILFEAALSFLGLGIMPPTASWGNMLNNAQELIYQAPFLALLPGIFILLTTVAFNFLGDGLQDALDPKSIRR